MATAMFHEDTNIYMLPYRDLLGFVNAVQTADSPMSCYFITDLRQILSGFIYLRYWALIRSKETICNVRRKAWTGGRLKLHA